MENTEKFRYRKELNFVKILLKKAYKKCILNKQKLISVKQDKSFVTNIDLNTEKFIISKIRRKFHDKNFLTEETHMSTPLGDRTWVIDPIDGTSFFVRNSALYNIQVAFYDKGKTQFSIIYLPRFNEMYIAMNGFGAYLNGKRLHRKCNVPMKNCFVDFNNIPSRWTEEIREKYKKLYNLQEKGSYETPKFFSIDSSGIVFSMLANGTIDFLVEPADTKWDFMPGDLLVKEVGANYYNFDNETYTRYYSFSQELDEYLGLTKQKNN